MTSRRDEFPFTINELGLFLAVCEAGSLTAAAKRLGVTQPAVSIALGELEKRLGTDLADRSTRPVALTPAGALLRQRASALLSEARQIGPMMREIERGRLPLLRIGLVDSLARSLSAPLARVAERFADEVAILSGLTASHAGALITRNLDVMIGLDDLADVSGLDRWPILDEPYVLALPAGEPAPASIEALEALGKRLRFVRFSARSSTGIDVERHLRRIGLELPRGLEFDTPHGVASLVAAGGCFTIATPMCLVESGMRPGEIACARLPGPAFARRVTLVAHRHHGRAPRALAEAARAELSGRVADEALRLSPALGFRVAS